MREILKIAGKRQVRVVLWAAFFVAVYLMGAHWMRAPWLG